MIKMLNTYLNADYKLISIYKDKIFVFEKDGNVNLSQSLKPGDDKNKNFIGIQSLKEATALFQDAEKHFSNVKSFDYILSSQIIEQSRNKFFDFIKEQNIKTIVNFCGLTKLKDRI